MSSLDISGDNAVSNFIQIILDGFSNNEIDTAILIEKWLKGRYI